MSESTTDTLAPVGNPPGSRGSVATRLKSYCIGLLLAVLLTAASFYASTSHLVWGPSTHALLAVLAIAQMGVHLVFFLHISSSPDSTNNVLALIFGVFVVALIVFGTLIIMANLNSNMMFMPDVGL